MTGRAKTIFGEPTYRYDVVGSTQDVAREWAERGAIAGTVVTARRMTAGRGRQGRTWEVPPGANVCLTIIAPPVAPEIAWQIALVAGVAVVEAINALAPGADARTRFPNDVYAKNRKLAGILVETLPVPGASLLPLLGIGVNVRAAPLPSEIAARAISLEEATGATHDVTEMEVAILSQLTLRWEQWESEGFAPLLQQWKENADFSLRRIFLIKGAETLCRITDLSAEGLLTLESDTGTPFTLPAEQIILGD